MSPMNKLAIWSWLPRMFHSFSLKQRIWFTFVILITVDLVATGSIAYSTVINKEMTLIEQSNKEAALDMY